MNRQRQIIVTVTYNDLGIIIDAKAEPRKKGKWISDSLCTTNGGTYGVRRCSVCESYYHDLVFDWNYCPNCGSFNGGDNKEDKK